MTNQNPVTCCHNVLKMKSKARYAPVKMTAELWERLWNNRYRPPHAGLYHGLLHFNQQMAEV